MVHVKRMAPALRWLGAFFDGIHGPLVRTHYAHARSTPVEWITTTDASPWGMGAVLANPRGLVEYFGVPLTRPDLD
eukprot:3276973-Alexandrium_andersonii.AAC.1